jgi:hypothetical protein
MRKSCAQFLFAFQFFAPFVLCTTSTAQSLPVLTFTASGGIGGAEGPPVVGQGAFTCYAASTSPPAPALLVGPLPTQCNVQNKFSQSATVQSTNPALTFGTVTGSGSGFKLTVTATNSGVGGVSGGVSLYRDNIPAPAGATIKLRFPGSVTGAGQVVVTAASDTGPGGSLVSVGAFITSAGTVTLPPLLIGKSGTYSIAVSAGVIANSGPQGPASSTASVTLGCNASPLDPLPASGTGGGLTGWSYDYEISDLRGLDITNVALQGRNLAAEMSVPYFNLDTSDFTGSHCTLQPSGTVGDCATRLVDFNIDPTAVEASYVAGNVPTGTSSCLIITERFEFDPPVPGDHCEPSGNLNCARFFPTVSYTYVPQDSTEIIQEADLPLRLFFTVPDPDPKSKTSLTSLGQFTTLAHDSDQTGFPDLDLNGDPMKTEFFEPNAINQGKAGDSDNYHQTYLPSVEGPGVSLFPPGPKPGCPTCVHIHWRWSSLFALQVAGVPLFPNFLDDNGGQPRIPPGSTQSVDIAVTAFPDNVEMDCSRLATPTDPLAGKPTVFWYCGKGNQDSDTFFSHGGFYNPPSPAPAPEPGITVAKSGLRVDHATGQWGQTVTLTNTTASALTGPMALVLDSLPSSVTLGNADGFTSVAAPLGSPYVLAALDESTQLGAGQSLTITLQFNNPSNVGITYSTRVLTGGLP